MARPELTGRIVSRLDEAERLEQNVHLRDDIRIAKLTVLFAARGSPAPHAEAMQKYLGLFPDQVWPAIVERRKAQLGRLYEKFYDADGRWKCDDDAERLPPKKPSKPVPMPAAERRRAAAGSWRANALPEGSNGSDKSKRRGVLRSAPPDAFVVGNLTRHGMASTQKVYRKPPQYSSENAALAQLPRIELVRCADLQSGIRELLLVLMSVNKLGNELYMGVERIAVEIGKVSPRSERITRRGVFYRLSKAVELGVLKVVLKPGTWVRNASGKRSFRRTATYQLVPDKLPLPRVTWEQYHLSLPAADPVEPIKPQSVREFPSAPARKPRQRDLTKVEMKYLYQEVPRLMKGVTRAADLGGGMGAVLSDSDPRYQRPLDRDAAIREACRRKDIPVEAATELLASWKPKGDA